MRPQKGSGRARLGTRQSPVLVGGGKSFGPKPRDFSSDLPRKMYDLAWRTALSWRYRRGELIVVEDGAELEHDSSEFLSDVFQSNHWGKGNGRTLVVTSGEKENLYAAMDGAGQHGRVLEREDVDVKDLLELGRVVIEKGALDWLLDEHQADLKSRVKILVPDATNAPLIRN
jgi:large subunit ribosomal protein L4